MTLDSKLSDAHPSEASTVGTSEARRRQHVLEEGISGRSSTCSSEELGLNPLPGPSVAPTDDDEIDDTSRIAIPDLHGGQQEGGSRNMTDDATARLHPLSSLRNGDVALRGPPLHRWDTRSCPLTSAEPVTAGMAGTPDVTAKPSSSSSSSSLASLSSSQGPSRVQETLGPCQPHVSTSRSSQSLPVFTDERDAPRAGVSDDATRLKAHRPCDNDWGHTTKHVLSRPPDMRHHATASAPVSLPTSRSDGTHLVETSNRAVADTIGSRHDSETQPATVVVPKHSHSMLRKSSSSVFDSTETKRHQHRSSPEIEAPALSPSSHRQMAAYGPTETRGERGASASTAAQTLLRPTTSSSPSPVVPSEFPAALTRCDISWPSGPPDLVAPIVGRELRPVISVQDKRSRSIVHYSGSDCPPRETPPAASQTVTAQATFPVRLISWRDIGPPLWDANPFLGRHQQHAFGTGATASASAPFDSSLPLQQQQQQRLDIDEGQTLIPGIRVRYRWSRGPPRPVCTFHPHRVAALQCTTSLRCFCNKDCFAHGHVHLRSFYRTNGGTPIPKHPNPHTLGVPCTPTRWDDFDANRDFDDAHFRLSKASGLLLSPDEEVWQPISYKRNYCPTADDIGRQLRFECLLEKEETTETGKEEPHADDEASWPPQDDPVYSDASRLTTFVTGCVITPPPRFRLSPMIQLGPSLTSLRPETPPPITVMTWNILAEIYSTAVSGMFADCEAFALAWPYRKRLLLEEIIEADADVVCLQEMQTEAFSETFLPKLRKHGYDGVYKRKTREIFTAVSAPDSSSASKGRFTMDGCATFFKTARFRLVDAAAVEFSQLILELHDAPSTLSMWFPELSSLATSDRSSLRRLLRDNVSLITLLEDLQGPTLHMTPPQWPASLKFQHKMNQDSWGAGPLTQWFDDLKPCHSWEGTTLPVSHRCLIVANTHIVANPAATEAKIWQSHALVRVVEAYREALLHILQPSLDALPRGHLTTNSSWRTSLHQPLLNEAPSHQLMIPEPYGKPFHPPPVWPDFDSIRSYSSFRTEREALRRNVGPITPSSVAILLVGDFNSTPDSAVYQLLSQGYCEANPHGVTANSLIDVSKLRHSLRLSSAYAEAKRSLCRAARICDPLGSAYLEPPLTNATKDFTGCLDYIFYDATALQISAFQPLPDEQQLRREAEELHILHMALPSPARPSDHLPLRAQFLWSD